MPSLDTTSLKQWFLSQKRDLPWRESPSPYSVWISEVMLQQTQAAVVIPYFLRWMERFPTITDLANAELDEVLKEWEGLGYYSRARHLHAGARYIINHFAGKLPDTAEELNKIKGLGAYTVAAILSFAFHQKAAAIDGNVLRVAARYFNLADDICKPKTVKMIRGLIQSILPDEEPWIINEALIELGATHCAKKARCHECPLQKSCKAFLSGLVDKLPIKGQKITTEFLYRAVAVVHSDHCLLVRRGEKGKVMADLYEFPYFATDEKGWHSDQFHGHLVANFDLELEHKCIFPEIKQTFTRFHATLRPFYFSALNRKEIPGMQWIDIEKLKVLPFSSGHKRIFDLIENLR